MEDWENAPAVNWSSDEGSLGVYASGASICFMLTASFSTPGPVDWSRFGMALGAQSAMRRLERPRKGRRLTSPSAAGSRLMARGKDL